MPSILKRMRRFGTGRILGLLLLMSLLALRVLDPGPVEAVRLKSLDIYQLIYPRAERQGLVAIVDIDEQSLRAMGQWPWPRTIMAEMVAKIVERGERSSGSMCSFRSPIAARRRSQPRRFKVWMTPRARGSGACPAMTPSLPMPFERPR